MKTVASVFFGCTKDERKGTILFELAKENFHFHIIWCIMKQKRKWIKIIHNAEKYKYIDRGKNERRNWELDDDANKTKKKQQKLKRNEISSMENEKW